MALVGAVGRWVELAKPAGVSAVPGGAWEDGGLPKRTGMSALLFVFGEPGRDGGGSRDFEIPLGLAGCCGFKV